VKPRVAMPVAASARVSFDVALSDLDAAVKSLAAGGGATVMIDDDLAVLLHRVTTARRVLDDVPSSARSAPPASLR